MKISFLFFYICLALLIQVLSQETDNKPRKNIHTTETEALYKNLKKLSLTGFLFGHQDDLAYGVNWRYQKGRSDVKDVAGDYPALFGWELSGIELDHALNIDSVPFSKMRQYIREAYKRGGVITISWHANSPLGENKTAWDTTKGTVATILPGGIHHEQYKLWLNKVAGFLQSLKGEKAEAIPVLFRPFHELTGSWFWWGKNECSAEEFKALWRFTFQYMTYEKKLHHLLWVYNTSDDFLSKEEFLERYPGDDVVDVVSFDAYQYGSVTESGEFVKKVNGLLKIVCETAAEKNKVAALAETGYEAIPYKNWWTEVLLKAIGNNAISYVLVWRNHGFHTGMNKMHYYAPFKGQLSAADFMNFYKSSKTIFERDAKALKMYSSF